MKTLTINFCVEIDGKQETGALSVPLDDRGRPTNVRATDHRGKEYVLPSLTIDQRWALSSLTTGLRTLAQDVILKGEPQ